LDYIARGIVQAFLLLLKRDPETFSAIFTTLKVSSISISISLLAGLPCGFALGYYQFPGKKILRTISDTLLALPTVVVGLIVYALISSRGPLGKFDLLFTIPGIAIAQVILVLPYVISLTASAVEGLDPRLKLTLKSFGTSELRAAVAVLMEARYGVFGAAITAYGRAISEVGISMMVGGNIKYHTRTITTAIALETAKGQFAMGVALGMILLLLALLVNWSSLFFKKKT